MGKQARLYMVRSTQGALYDVFFERGVVALAWPMLAEAAAKGFGREELTDIYRSAVPNVKLRTAQSGAAQMWRFGQRVVRWRCRIDLLAYPAPLSGWQDYGRSGTLSAMGR